MSHRILKTTVQRSVRRESSNVKGFGGRALGSPTFHLSRFLKAQRERRMGKGASLGEEAVLADSGRAGEKSDLFSILIMELCRSV